MREAVPRARSHVQRRPRVLLLGTAPCHLPPAPRVAFANGRMKKSTLGANEEKYFGAQSPPPSASMGSPGSEREPGARRAGVQRGGSQGFRRPPPSPYIPLPAAELCWALPPSLLLLAAGRPAKNRVRRWAWSPPKCSPTKQPALMMRPASPCRGPGGGGSRASCLALRRVGCLRPPKIAVVVW